MDRSDPRDHDWEDETSDAWTTRDADSDHPLSRQVLGGRAEGSDLCGRMGDSSDFPSGILNRQSGGHRQVDKQVVIAGFPKLVNIKYFAPADGVLRRPLTIGREVDLRRSDRAEWVGTEQVHRDLDPTGGRRDLHRSQSAEDREAVCSKAQQRESR
ncbi:MAG: hypothetical protein CM1200mP2_22700 [Planctomycetaceae bacterium]|nr:MAG: hypothetical protein CM1200mP2_22700 [Planctomycetaceae bacterium]